MAPNPNNNACNIGYMNEYCTNLTNNAIEKIRTTSKDTYLQEELSFLNIYKLFPNPDFCQTMISLMYDHHKEIQNDAMEAIFVFAERRLKAKRRSEALMEPEINQEPPPNVVRQPIERPRNSVLKFPAERLLEMYPADANGMVTLGSKGTKMRRSDLEAINWAMTSSFIVRRIVSKIFDRRTLATHNLSGKHSFLGRHLPPKFKLDPNKVSDIILFLTNVANMSISEIRSAISAKCSFESRRARNLQNRTDDE